VPRGSVTSLRWGKIRFRSKGDNSARRRFWLGEGT
jgi:hypothetical protein